MENHPEQNWKLNSKMLGYLVQCDRDRNDPICVASPKVPSNHLVMINIHYGYLFP
jgi:hypothetical protein